jgi:hypothetical protein
MPTQRRKIGSEISKPRSADAGACRRAERPGASPPADAELIESTYAECDDIGPAGGYGGAGPVPPERGKASEEDEH